MGREQDREKTILWAGTATTFAAVTLYAMGKLLSFMFRDVDPEQNEKEPAKVPADEPPVEAEAETVAETAAEETEKEPPKEAAEKASEDTESEDSEA